MNKPRIFILGGAGYVGIELCKFLLKSGYEVICFDIGWFGSESVKKLIANKSFQYFEGDLRNLKLLQSASSNSDVFIHLACISNDPSFDLDPNLGKQINYDSFNDILNIVNKNKIKRFIYASSSSVYGVKTEKKVTEDLSLNPLTDYSKFKAMCENELLNSNFSFEKVILRPATVCGYSDRLRLDLVVNILASQAYFKRKITVFGGSQFRPNIHIQDMCRAYQTLIEAKSSKIHNEIFNVGGTNYTVEELANIVKDTFEFPVELEFKSTNDLRSYKVNSDKIKNKLSFAPIYHIKDAIKDLKTAFATGKYDDFETNDAYYNIRVLKKLC